VKVGFVYKLRPGRRARRWLLNQDGACRWLWNRLVDESKTRYTSSQPAREKARELGLAGDKLDDYLEAAGATFGYAAQDKLLTRLRQATTCGSGLPVNEAGQNWLRQGSSVAQQQLVRDFAKSRSKALQDRRAKMPAGRRAGLPDYQSKNVRRPTLRFTRRGFSLRTVTGDSGVPVVRLILPDGVQIPVVWSRDLPGEPSSVRVHQDAVGDWWASFSVEIAPQVLTPTGHGVLGIDPGVAQVMTTTDDTLDFDHPQHGRDAARQLAAGQRVMARRKPPKGQPASKGYVTAKREVARLHRRVAWQRQDDQFKWAFRVVHCYGRVALEDFRPKFLSRTSMARKASDGAIAAMMFVLVYMACKYGCDLRLVVPKNTTQDCCRCGARAKHHVGLGERVYRCWRCGLNMPRDKNSAHNMVLRGFPGETASYRAGLVPACVDDVRPGGPAAGRGLLEHGIPRL